MVVAETSAKSAEQIKQLMFRRARKLLLPSASGQTPAEAPIIAAFIENLESVGYELTPQLMGACQSLSIEELDHINDWLMSSIKIARGNKPFAPMYPNFPRQVMDTSKAILYLNAARHYIASGKWLPEFKKENRDALDERGNMQRLDIGATSDVLVIFRDIITSNTSVSQQDKDDLRAIIGYFGEESFALIPSAIPNRENKAFLLGQIISKGEQALAVAEKLCTTATDILRLAVSMSDGDVSLATPCKFRSFKRVERRALLNLLEKQNNIQEDMLRWKERWKRLGEKLHPLELEKTHPESALAFMLIRNNLKLVKFSTKVEAAFIARDADQLIALLRTRPGEFARRLDHLLRNHPDKESEIAAAFSEIASQVSTPVLLQVMHHFKHRPRRGELRVFLPKSDVGKAQVIPSKLPELPSTICNTIATECRAALVKRFSKLAPLGKCYIEPTLSKFAVPGSQRSAAKTLRTIARGSRLALPTGDTLRFFIWWKNGKDRTDLDLSAILFREDFSYIDVVAYYNLKNFGGHHSGDIVDAPLGASEFIDISTARCRERDVRYVVMCVTSFTQQPYCDLPECFAGWMSREKPDSGEVYEPRTVFDRLDLTANTKIALPAIFDLQAKEILWLDLSLKGVPHWSNNVGNNLHNIQWMMKAFSEREWLSLSELLHLHVEARGQLVSSETEAETVFSVANETPFHIERIASEFLSD